MRAGDLAQPYPTAIMARARSPLVAVATRGELLGAITLDALLDRMLAE